MPRPPLGGARACEPRREMNGVDYPGALAYLYSFTDAERHPGLLPAGVHDLAKVHAFYDRIGRPETAYATILVAGSKGKGSTAGYLAGALRAAGYRTGLYTQPHLTSFRERMQVDGRLIAPDTLARVVAAIAPLVAAQHADAPALGRLSTYEISTAVALRYFAEERVDFAVLEIGLGGRLDAVNAVRDPRLSIITSLSLDHTQVLGDTVEQIAFEKAGIIRPGCPIVSAPQPPGALAVIQAAAAERGAPLYVVGADVRLPGTPAAPLDCAASGYGRAPRRGQTAALAFGERLRAAAGAADPGPVLELTLPLLGAHQQRNAAAAAAGALLLAGAGADRLTPAAIRAGFAAVIWPGRLEIVRERPLLVLDGAHNGNSAEQLAAAVRQNLCYRRLILVLGAMADKDLAAILRPLLPITDMAIFTQVDHPRAAPGPALAEIATGLAPGAPAVRVVPGVAAAVAAGLALAGPDDLILVTGSLYVVGDARAALGLGPPPDPPAAG